MRFYSTSSKGLAASARQAVLQGLSVDGGLFMPEAIPELDPAELREFRSASFSELSFRVLRPFFEDIPAADLETIAHSAFNFEVPLKEIEPGISVLELFHGPTLAFKDFGARFLARIMSFYRQGAKRELTVLVATSGDTGSAVAHGFFRVPGIRVVLLYPSGKVSRIQEQQLTTLGENVTALEIDGTFDDCQRLVKEAFLDADLRQSKDLTSANSINIGRLLPQMSYYFSAVSRLPDDNGKPLVVSVPSGNLGNLAAGVFARKMGLPISKFVAALNRNDVFAEYLESGEYRSRVSFPTTSNAMDVGNPSNIARLIDLAGSDAGKLRAAIEAHSFTDEETAAEIADVFRRTSYVLDPHGAVGLLGLRKALAASSARGIFLETAAPAKFIETVEAAIGQTIEIPEPLKQCLAKKKLAQKLGARFDELKSLLLS